MYYFAVIKEKVFCGNDTFVSFGIRATKNEKVLFTFSNITFDENTIEKFAALCNKHQISPVHFEDVLENFLADFQTL